MPLLQADIERLGVGEGNATFLAAGQQLEGSAAFLAEALRVAQIVSPRTPPALASRPRRSSGAADGNASCPALLPYPYGSPSAGTFCCSVEVLNGIDCPSGVLCCLSRGLSKGCSFQFSVVVFSISEGSRASSIFRQ